VLKLIFGIVSMILGIFGAGSMVYSHDGHSPQEAISGDHFIIVSRVDSPSPQEIKGFLEKTWQRFHDLFGVDPPTVQVVLNPGGGLQSGGSRADQGIKEQGGQDTGSLQGKPVMAWTVSEGETLDSQGFNDLSHEIAHIYFLDLMGNPQGVHQPHAWLHEAVACFHEGEQFIRNREEWIQRHLSDFIPLLKLFSMKNPVKVNPMVELTVSLQKRLAKGEITVSELNRQISEYASQNAEAIARSGALNMTYYSQALSLFQYLLAKEGKTFIRSMVKRLREDQEMGEIIGETDHYPHGVETVEEGWLDWVKG